MRPASFFRLALLALPLAAVACEDSDLFSDKKTPLTGTRRELFPSGVPGVDYTQPPVQPSNSNVPLNTEVSKNLLTDQPAAQPPAAEEQPKGKAARKAQQAQQAQQQKPPKRASTRNAAPADDSDDPWSGARTAAPD